MKDETTTIQLKKSVVKELNDVKKYERETYNEVIMDIIDFIKSAKMSGKYEEFIGFMQQKRMGELWDSKEDEVWENV